MSGWNGARGNGAMGGGELDPVRRLRVLAAGIPAAQVSERVIPAPFPRVWEVLADLEGEWGGLLPDMRRVRVVASDGDRLTALARSRYGFRARLEGVRRPGWCWLQSRFLLVGMAAAPAGDAATRVAFTGGVRALPYRRGLVPLGVRTEGRRTLARLEKRLCGPG